MKNSTLLFRSLFFIILIAGGAHLVSYATDLPVKKAVTTLTEVPSSVSESRTSSTFTEELPETSLTDYILGRWRVQYNSKDFTGAIQYLLTKEGSEFHAYTDRYEDKHGNTQKAPKVKTLVITVFDGYKGSGRYTLTYQGKTYTIDCQIHMEDKTTLQLSYDYYGYSDVETWKKL